MMTNAVIPLLEPFTKLNEAVAFFISTTNEGSENALAMEIVDLNAKAKELEQSIENNESAWGRFKNVATFESTDTEVLKKQLEEVNRQIDEARSKAYGDANRRQLLHQRKQDQLATHFRLQLQHHRPASPTVGNNADQINSQLEAIQDVLHDTGATS